MQVAYHFKSMPMCQAMKGEKGDYSASFLERPCCYLQPLPNTSLLFQWLKGRIFYLEKEKTYAEKWNIYWHILLEYFKTQQLTVFEKKKYSIGIFFKRTTTTTATPLSHS